MVQILLVEDEPAHVELIRRAFEHTGEKYDFIVYDTVAGAQEYLRHHLPGIAIVDWNLLDGRGRDLLMELTQRDVPFLYMTSFGNESLAVEVMKAGAFDYIVKSPEEFQKMPLTVKRILREWEHIQQKKRAEETLRQYEGQLRALINTTDDNIWSVDRHFRIIVCNTALKTVIREYFGANISEGSCILDVFPETPHNSRSLWQRAFEQVFAEGQRMSMEYDWLWFNIPHYWDVSLNPIIAEHGNILGVSVVTRDITARKTAESSLHTMVQEKERLLQEVELQKKLALQAFAEGQENERSRIARDLHDGVGHQLSLVKIGLSSFQDTIAPHKGAEELTGIIATLDSAVQEIRSVSHQLTPAALNNVGLHAALEDILTTLGATTGITVTMALEPLRERLDTVLEKNIYRIVQELINNTVKYANARTISLQFIRESASLLMMYEDDGQGFLTAQHSSGIGLSNIASRAAILGGIAEIHSSPGTGMVATIDIPLV